MFGKDHGTCENLSGVCTPKRYCKYATNSTSWSPTLATLEANAALLAHPPHLQLLPTHSVLLQLCAQFLHSGDSKDVTHEIIPKKKIKGEGEVRTHPPKTRTQTVLDATCDLVKVCTLSLAVHFAFGDLTVRHVRDARPTHFCVWQARLERSTRFSAWAQSDCGALCHLPALTSSFSSCSLLQMTLRSMVKGDMVHRTMIKSSIG